MTFITPGEAFSVQAPENLLIWTMTHLDTAKGRARDVDA